MNSGADPESISLVSLEGAVFCVDCEIVSNSPHEVCTACGSRSLVSLYRFLGSLRKNDGTRIDNQTVKYNVDLTLKIRELAGDDLNRLISLFTEMRGNLQTLHLNIESVLGVDRRDILKVA
jgi:hypothetical protein